MAYMKYKEVTRAFNFSKVLNDDDLPGYIKHYVPEDENILVAYKTSRDHGVFTDKKIVLFDNINTLNRSKRIYTIPFKSVSVLDIVFGEKSAELNFSLDCGFPVKLKFVDMKAEDKIRLRLLYTCINRIVNGQEPLKEDIRRLKSDEVSLKKV
ncbi:MAG: PH domain-containing protein [Bacilli bacterium]|jgi:hypothetical protein|nr:PH domain-containing protein [Bacilli bacterium]